VRSLVNTEILESVRKKFFRRIEKNATWEKKDIKSTFMGVMLDIVMSNGKRGVPVNPVKRNRRKAKVVADAGNSKE
jgi:hypothetical protein